MSQMARTLIVLHDPCVKVAEFDMLFGRGKAVQVEHIRLTLG